MTLPPGTRVRLNDRCPWPERRGCLATVVGEPEGSRGVYPFDKPLRATVVLLLDDDPIRSTRYTSRKWSCVVSTRACDVLEPAS